MRYTSLTVSFAGGAALLCTYMVNNAAAAGYSFAQLPFGYAMGVSADGSVVVGATGGSVNRAVRWTSGGGLVELGGDAYWAQGVSADGSTVVGYAWNSAPAVEGFRWTADEGVVLLGVLPDAHPAVDYRSGAQGTSGDGSIVVGGSVSVSHPYNHEPFRWTSGGGMQGLDHLPGEGDHSGWASAISADGSVIVGFEGGYAFRWEGAITSLGVLPGGYDSTANAVSADGSVIVGGSSSSATIDHEAFRWTAGGGMIGLGFLPGANAFFSEASGVSADGSVVVGATWATGPSASNLEAFIWTAEMGLVSLRELLIANGVTGLEYYSLEYATAISADGRTIVGWGGYNGYGGLGWIVTVPEPSTWVLAGAGFVALSLHRLRRALRATHTDAVSRLEPVNVSFGKLSCK